MKIFLKASDVARTIAAPTLKFVRNHILGTLAAVVTLVSGAYAFYPLFFPKSYPYLYVDLTDSSTFERNANELAGLLLRNSNYENRSDPFYLLIEFPELLYYPQDGLADIEPVFFSDRNVNIIRNGNYEIAIDSRCSWNADAICNFSYFSFPIEIRNETDLFVWENGRFTFYFDNLTSSEVRTNNRRFQFVLEGLFRIEPMSGTQGFDFAELQPEGYIDAGQLQNTIDAIYRERSNRN